MVWVVGVVVLFLFLASLCVTYEVGQNAGRRKEQAVPAATGLGRYVNGDGPDDFKYECRWCRERQSQIMAGIAAVDEAKRLLEEGL